MSTSPTTADRIELMQTFVPRIAVAAPSLLAGQPLPTHPEQLAALPWLALRTFYRNGITLHHTSGASHRLALQPRMSSDGLFAIRNAAVQGMGVCVVSSWALRDELAQGTLLHLVPEWQATPLPMYLVYPHAPHYPARLRSFIDNMRAAMPAILSDL